MLCAFTECASSSSAEFPRDDSVFYCWLRWEANTNANPDTCCFADSYSYPYVDCKSDSNANTYFHSDSNCHCNGHSKSDADTNSYTEPDSNTNSYSYPNP
jgi:hypothetical protein